ncbi:hypothetical protein HCN44_001035 [Aphidius gifuensis]|uniref:Uncharacterized protein n=1 Tax=Aphidius gifuensis TaxID=684658 RepID=A0A834XMY7_APHGI|nr:hypothetical protein HCN44_001035 [Aphidius gifuensis]
MSLTIKAEFNLPENFNYENLTFLKISSCSSANINLINQPNAKLVRDIEIQNISKRLIFEPTFMSKTIGIIELKNIGIISRISHDTFINITKIDLLKIENSRITNFDEQFTNLNIRNLILKNVTIDNMIGINFSGDADTLKIIDTIIHNIKENMNFAFFTTIEIINSTFEFKKSSDMWIQGKISKISNCIFSNVSINIVSRQRITMKNNCADGKSSLRLSSMSTNSYDNKLPTEIIYTENKMSKDHK